MKQKICAILILAMVLVMAMAFPTAAEVPFSFPEGTVHYGFDNQTVNDSGKNGFHGTLNGEGVTYVDGLNGGYALQMDANSYANIPVDATNLEDSMTYILWFKTETLIRHGTASLPRVCSVPIRLPVWCWVSSVPMVPTMWYRVSELMMPIINPST